MKDTNEIIRNLADGEIDMMTAFALAYSINGCADIGVAQIDHSRNQRCGFPEFIYGAGKTPQQICAIIPEILKTGHPVLATRVSKEAAATIVREFPQAEYNQDSGTLIIRNCTIPKKKGKVAIVTAGTSDLAIAHEAAAVIELCGIKFEIINDVGVAGIHRIFAAADRLTSADAVIVIAGMEGALPSVVGGLVKCPVIAVPTSVGYGAALKGFSALMGMLNSCASGVTVVNIDNGFGAGCAAVRIINGLR